MVKSEEIRQLWIEKAEKHITDIEIKLALLKQTIEFIK